MCNNYLVLQLGFFVLLLFTKSGQSFQTGSVCCEIFSQIFSNRVEFTPGIS